MVMYPNPKNNILRTFLILIVALAITKTSAQVRPVTRINFEPYKDLVDIKLNHSKGIKRKAYLVKYQKGKISPYDTVYIETYDRTGKETSYTEFKANTRQRGTTTLMSYKMKNNMPEVVYEDVNTGNPDKRVVDSIFNKRGQDSIVRSVETYRKDPTVYRIEYLSAYDDSGRLVNYKYTMNDRPVSYTNYYYREGKLVKEEFFYNLRLKNTWKETTYTYSPDNLLTKQEVYGMDDGKKTLMGYNYYTYNSKRLTMEVYWELSRDTTTTTVNYDYSADGALSKLFIKKDSLYKIVQYQYQEKKISKIHVETTAGNELSREYVIPVYLANQKKLLVMYDVEFNYDKKGNIMEWKSFLNGVLQNSYGFDLQYY